MTILLKNGILIDRDCYLGKSRFEYKKLVWKALLSKKLLLFV